MMSVLNFCLLHYFDVEYDYKHFKTESLKYFAVQELLKFSFFQCTVHMRRY